MVSLKEADEANYFHLGRCLIRIHPPAFYLRECTYSYIQNQTNEQNLVSAIRHKCFTRLVLSTEQINYILKNAC